MVLHEPLTPQDAAEIMVRCDMLVGERLHALITAAILGIPIVPLVYDVKVREAMKLLGTEDFAIEIDEHFDHAALTSHVLALHERRDHVSSCLKTRASELREEAREYFEMINGKILEVGS